MRGKSSSSSMLGSPHDIVKVMTARLVTSAIVTICFFSGSMKISQRGSESDHNTGGQSDFACP